MFGGRGLVVGMAVVSVVPLGADGAQQAPPSSSTCETSCVELARVGFDHPSWGPVDLVVESEGSSPDASCVFTVVDAQQSVRWSGSGPGCAHGARIIEPAPDTDGNLFVEYSTERYGGVTVLRPTPDGMNDLGTLPSSGTAGGSSGRFEDSSMADVDGDGRYEVVSILRPCEPDCSSGAPYFQTFRWNGSDFATELCTVRDWPTIAIQATPESGGTVIGAIPPGTCGVTSTDTIGFLRGWIGVDHDGVLGFAPADAFVWPPTEPPPNLGPWATQDEAAGALSPSQQLLDALPLAPGATGPEVVELQELLMAAGNSVGPDGADGLFGIDTAMGVAMLDDSVFAMGAEDDPVISGVMTAAKVPILEAAISSNAPDVVSGACPALADFVAALADWGGGIRLVDLTCAGGWATGYVREYHFTDSSQVFFTIGDAGPELVGSVYAENGCEAFDVPAELWEPLGCGAPPPVVPSQPAACGDYRYNLDYPIRRCDQGPAVSVIQSVLWFHGAPIEIDGYFGPATEAAVRSFQTMHGLEVDGLVGPRTWATMLDGDFAMSATEPAFAWIGLVAESVDWDGNGVVDPDELAVGD